MYSTHRIRLGVPTGKSLIGRIEEDHVFLGTAQTDDLFPFLDGGIGACGIVRTRVQQHDGSFGRTVQIAEHPP